jgi:hypothetical protein
MTNNCESGTCALHSNHINPKDVDANTITLSPAKDTKILSMIINTTAERVCIEESEQQFFYEKVEPDDDTIYVNHKYCTKEGKVPVVTITLCNQDLNATKGVLLGVTASANNITFISFTTSKDMAHVDLSDNQLSSLFLPTIANVKNLDLHNNPILNLNENVNMCNPTDKGLHQLEYIDVTHTLIHTLRLSHCAKLKNIFHDTENYVTGYKVEVETSLLR